MHQIDISRARSRAGVAIDAAGVGHVHRDGRRVLEDITLSIAPGRVVAIVGASGAGKSTLLDALAGVRPASEGTVRFDGADVASHRGAFRAVMGYVPQDDIIHRDLPLRSTLRYAAQLRLPTSTSDDAIDAIVDETLTTLELDHHADVRVGELSGGQRKRASIGVELLTSPRVFFLDEPTSGLDPSTARGLMQTLQRLAADGATVVLTTHHTDDLKHCDEMVLLGRGGRIAFHGGVEDAMEHFDTTDLSEIYELVANEPSPGPWAARMAAARAVDATPATPAPTTTAPPLAGPPGPGPVRQWSVLTRRSLDVLWRNHLTLAIVFGSPALVVGMFVVLFEPGAFDAVDPDPTAAVMITFWTAFAGFFFGLTFGLLQICTEISVVRRERFVGLGVVPYLLAKLTVLVPVLIAVVATMLGVLGALDRLPSLGVGATVALAVTVLLDAVAAVALGLLASAAVAEPSHATLALPMLCFPAVLFSGGVLPVEAMAGAGEAISLVTSDRWAFEAIGRQLEVGALGSTSRHSSVLEPYGDAFAGGATGHWLVLGAFTVAFLVAAAKVLARRTTPGSA